MYNKVIYERKSIFINTRYTIIFDDLYFKLGLKKPKDKDFEKDFALLSLKRLLDAYFININTSASVGSQQIRQIVTYKTKDEALIFDLLINFDYENNKATIFIDQSNNPHVVKQHLDIALEKLLK